MFEPKAFIARASRRLFSSPADQPSAEPKQRRLMAVALTLLVVSLVFVLYHDRDFWFPDTQEAEDQSEQTAPATNVSAQVSTAQQGQITRKKSHSGKPQLNASPEAVKDTPPIFATATRTVLPPLEVEVIAGNSHRRLKPTPNAVQVDVQPDSPDETAENPPAIAEEPAATVTDNASERVQMSADTSEVVTEPVRPGYPLLARQMKVQGSVILLALISREGSIQDLRVLSGPPILAGAAREAVKQWHFKPHYEGKDIVETVAKVTVNFTISTN
jgi:TonB family protein